MLKVLDLFSGIGGFSLGLERTGGFETVAFCEKAEFPRKVLRKHWPNIPIYKDVENIDVTEIDAQVYTGGFPCTQTSIAACIHKKRTGMDGKDSGLWFHYLRHIETGRPEWAIVENPGGVKKWESEIQGRMEAIGYTVSRLEFKASDFGLPHIRKRYFYIANRNGKRLEITRSKGSPTIEWYERLAASGGTWLSDSPGACGIYNGLPNRVDRLKGLGNAVVPQIPELIGRAILEEINRKG